MKSHASTVMVIALAVPRLCALQTGGEDAHVGWIQNIDKNCRGQWRENDRATPTQLTDPADHYRFLYPGDSLRCDGSGSMSLQILDHIEKKISKRNGWCRIGYERAVCEKEENGTTISSEATAPPTANADDKDAITHFGRAAGRLRGSRSVIFCPADEGTVVAEKLAIRWNAITGAARITLRLTDKYHTALWEQEVDAAAGQLTSREARKALVTYRDQVGAGPFTLILTQSGEDEPAVHFSVLKAEEELALNAELTGCDRHAGLLRSVCRAYAFTRREMRNDSAEEYEAALKLEPGSRDLLLAALRAQRGIGNTARASELSAELPAGTENSK